MNEESVAGLCAGEPQKTLLRRNERASRCSGLHVRPPQEAVRKVRSADLTRVMVWTACLFLFLVSEPGAHGQSLTITLEDALEIAREQNALLRAASLRVDESRGDLVAAAVRLVNNPQLSLQAGPRRADSGRETTDWSVALSQRFELRGQRRSRLQQAEGLLGASEFEAEDARRVLELGVAIAFFEVIASQERVRLFEEGDVLAQSLLELSERRLDLGEGTPLEVNTARLRSAAASADLLEARALERRTGLRLKELLGLGSSQKLAVRGSLPASQFEFVEEMLVEKALESRPDLVAVRQVAEAAGAAVDLAAADAWPGVAGGLSLSREEGDEIALATISLPLPFANRNRGERQRALAAELRLRSETNSARLRVETEVRTTFVQYELARERLDLFDDRVLTAQQESLTLLERALAAGEVGYAEVLVVQREVLGARLRHLDAQLALAEARAALLAAAHLPQTGSEDLAEDGDQP